MYRRFLVNRRLKEDVDVASFICKLQTGIPKVHDDTTHIIASKAAVRAGIAYR